MLDINWQSPLMLPFILSLLAVVLFIVRKRRERDEEIILERQVDEEPLEPEEQEDTSGHDIKWRRSYSRPSL